MRVSVDPAKCSGHARCAAAGPEVYELDDLGYALPAEREVPGDLERQARAGLEACPERAISAG